MPLNPLHHSIVGRVDPEYEDFYNAYLANVQSIGTPLHELKARSELIPGGTKPLKVGRIIDLSIERSRLDSSLEPGEFQARCFIPSGDPPANGWPVVLYIHSGGWVLGTIDTENHICSQICNRARCAVISPDYRLAPEHVYPAAEEDSWATALWIQGEGLSRLNLDPTNAVIVGCSAGGNLAGATCQRATRQHEFLNFSLQVLVAPALDHTASTENNQSWAENAHSPGLPAEKVLWYRNHYIPERALWKQASPLHFLGDLTNLPQALIVVGELDVLRTESELYAKKLVNAGVKAVLEVVPGVPHAFFGMDAALHKTRLVWDKIIGTIASVIGK